MQSDDAGTVDIAGLTRRMMKGEDVAYRLFFDAYFDRLNRYLLVVTAGDETRAGEALQAALTRVVKHVRVFSDEPTFWSWLTVIARSALSDEGRKRRRYLAFLDRFMRHVEIGSQPPEPAPIDERLSESLRRNLRLMDPDDRQLLEWKYDDREPVREIALRLCTSEKAIEARLVRARRKLKEAVLAEINHETSS